MVMKRLSNKVHDQTQSQCQLSSTSLRYLVGRDRDTEDFLRLARDENGDQDLGNSHCQQSLDIDQLIADLNSQLALFRQLLITVGQPKDSPEIREKIRRLRRQCVDVCKHTTQLLLPPIKNELAEGILVDKDQLVHFFCCTQLLARELRRSFRLIKTLPLDMTENRPGPSGLGGVLSQIILCKQLAPDFNQEELHSIIKDTEDVQKLLDDLQEFMPLAESNGRAFALAGDDPFSIWAKKRRRNPLYKNVRSFCCHMKPSGVL